MKRRPRHAAAFSAGSGSSSLTEDLQSPSACSSNLAQLSVSIKSSLRGRRRTRRYAYQRCQLHLLRVFLSSAAGPTTAGINSFVNIGPALSYARRTNRLWRIPSLRACSPAEEARASRADLLHVAVETIAAGGAAARTCQHISMDTYAGDVDASH